MIVKNENGPHLLRCLDSVRPFITSWAIVDTGSTDGTQSQIRRYMADIPGQLIEREWVYDFAHSRNQALQLARESGARLAMNIDADDYVEVAAWHPRRLRRLRPLTADACLFTCIEGDTVSTRFTFARLAAPIYWTGRVHEELVRADGLPLTRVVDSWYITRMTRDGAASRDPAAKIAHYIRCMTGGTQQGPASDSGDGRQP